MIENKEQKYYSENVTKWAITAMISSLVAIVPYGLAIWNAFHTIAQRDWVTSLFWFGMILVCRPKITNKPGVSG